MHLRSPPGDAAATPDTADTVNILGFNCYMHDSAAALLSEGQVRCAVAEERFTRRKHVGDFPAEAIRYCLRDGGLEVDDLDCVTFFYKPWDGFLKRVLHAVRHLPHAGDLASRRAGSWNRFRTADDAFRTDLGIEPGGGPEFLFVEHHLAHAASAFFCSPFEEAAILSIDGAGEWTTTLAGRGVGSQIEKLTEVSFPHSLGNVYSAVTQYLGFRPNGGEGKVMGLAPYGDPARFIDTFQDMVRLSDGGRFEIELSYFQHHLGKERRYSDRLIDALGPAREPESDMTGHYEDIAAALQLRLEETVVHLARHLQRTTGLKRLCMAGGVALNSVANGKVLAETDFDEIFIQPAAGDDGTSLGGALYAHVCLKGGERPEPMRHAYLGPQYSDDDCRGALESAGLRPVADVAESQLADRMAELLEQQKIVALYQGRAEFGPRALGNRSILTDPRSQQMKDTLNARVKRREGFRPFAPVVLAERRHEFFSGQHGSPYMLLVEDVRADKADELQAITHVDGTARVQDIERDINPLYYDTVAAFGERTGVPVLLNTSFNVRGEPIINTPEEAVLGFLNMDIDALVLGRYLLQKEDVATG